MLEHVGWRNHRNFMEVAHRCVKDDGIVVLHTIGSNVNQRHGIPFFEKHIFPNAASPSLAQLGNAMENLFVLEDLHNIGPDYRPTLLAWWKNFEAKGYPIPRSQQIRSPLLADVALLSPRGGGRGRGARVAALPPRAVPRRPGPARLPLFVVPGKDSVLSPPPGQARNGG